MSDYSEFMTWLEANRDGALKDRTVDEIVPLAIACGLDRATVNQWRMHEIFKEMPTQDNSNG